MLPFATAFALAVQDPPRPAPVSAFEYCQTVSARDRAAGGAGLQCGRESTPLVGPVTLERCLGEREAGRHEDCRAVLQPEADLVPALLFNTAGQTPPARLQGWLDVVCAGDRLEAGQTAQSCQSEKTALHGRAYAAREAMAGRGPSATEPEWASRGSERFPVTFGDDPFATGIDAEGGFDIETRERTATSTTVVDAEEPLPPNGCERREDVRRDEYAGTSSASYSMNCSWGSGDADLRRRNRETLDALMRGD